MGETVNFEYNENTDKTYISIDGESYSNDNRIIIEGDFYFMNHIMKMGTLRLVAGKEDVKGSDLNGVIGDDKNNTLVGTDKKTE